MKTIFTLIVVLILGGLSLNSYGQLSGSKFIPGNYATISAAIGDLNFQGVGNGGVVFNVAAGHTETASNLVVSITTNQPTYSNTVVFQKSGVGTNPLITAAPGTSATADGIIKISGSDYITFDAIDLVDPSSNSGNAMMEWGYALMRASTTDGTQNSTIKNCVVTLQKINTASFGIYIANRDISGTVIVPADSNGQNSFNRIFGNTISNVYKGIVVISASTSRDINNQVGVVGENPNSVTNFGGSSVATEGIRCEGQINVKINNNIVNGGTGTTSGVYGIIATLFGATGVAPNYEISYNRITVTPSASSSGTYGIRALATGDTVRIHHNIVENCATSHTTSSFNALVHDPTGITRAANVYNNIIRNNTHSGTGTATLLGCIGTITNLLIRSNVIHGNQKTGVSGTMNCILAGNASVECDSNLIHDNSIPSTSGTSAVSIFGYSNPSSPIYESINNNVIYNLTVGGSNTSPLSLSSGIRSNSSTPTVKYVYDNLVYSISAISGSGFLGGATGIVCCRDAASGQGNAVFRNRIFDVSNSGTASNATGLWITSGKSVLIYNNFISNVNAPNSGNPNSVVGVNITSTDTNSNIDLYHNSIYLNASSSGTSFGSAGLLVAASSTATTASLELKNNIIINLSAPGSLSGQTVAYRRTNSSLQNFENGSNYNLFYAGIPGVNRLIFADDVNGDQTIIQYKSRMFPRETNSNSKSITFQNSIAGDLHIAGNSIGDVSLLGTPIIGMTADIDNELRDSAKPYKGADESSPISIPLLNLTVNLEACSPVQDTVTVFLRNAISPFPIVDFAKGYLSQTGTVSLEFTNAANNVNYYIVVKHRNSIETWSKSGGEIFTAGSLTYDFTASASQAFGNNMVLVGSKYSFYTGDVNNDGIVDAGDASLIDNDVFNFVSGFVITDLNCDSIVDATDAAYAVNNAFNFVGLIRP